MKACDPQAVAKVKRMGILALGAGVETEGIAAGFPGKCDEPQQHRLAVALRTRRRIRDQIVDIERLVARQHVLDAETRQYLDALHELWLHAITTCVYAEETVVSALYPTAEYPERPDLPWRSEEPRKLMLSEDQQTELGRWLERPRTFKEATRTRTHAVTRNVEWPW